MKTEIKKPTVVTIPAGTAAMLRQMFSAHDGVNMESVIKDLGADSSEDLAAINLGLLLNGYSLKTPEVVYTWDQCRDGKIRYIYMYKKISHSILKDQVFCRRYQFELVTNQETGKSEWKQNTYAPRESCTVASWFEKEQNLPEGIVLPELNERD